MSNILYYFTGTGNSLAVAKKIEQKINGFSLVPIHDAIKQPLPSYSNLIGISFPVYAYRPPHIVATFLRRLKKEGIGKYIFVIANSGGGPGNVLSHVKRMLKSKKLQAGFSLHMPFNYLPFGNVPLPSEQRKLYTHAEKRINTIAEIIENRQTHFDPVRNVFRTYIHPGIVYTLAYPTIPTMDKKFWTDEGCNGCTTCGKVCPVQNIRMHDNKPTWLHHCEQCYACVHWCPVSSIQWGDKTTGKKRYHHPEIKLKELLV